MNPNPNQPTPQGGQDIGMILGIASMVSAIGSWLIGPFGIVTAIIAIATDIMARGRAKLNGNTAASVLGILGIVVAVLYFIVGVVIIGLIGGAAYFLFTR